MVDAKRTVVVQANGGLGNQMFQVAAGISLAARMDAHLFVDVSGLDPAVHNGFELNQVFGRQFAIADKEVLRRVLGWRGPLRNLLARRRFAALPLGALVVEPTFAYWDGWRTLREDCYLAGYWQSEKYFFDATGEIRRSFRFRALPPTCDEYADLARRANAVSVHVRRGDYAHNPGVSAFHGLCGIDYYERAIAHVSDSAGVATYLVFSDDLEWCRDNLRLPGEVRYVGVNRGKSSFNDMHLMSLCRHHIIANSSFSWWGAWLGEGHDGIVVAPKRWFAVATENESTICPSRWHRL